MKMIKRMSSYNPKYHHRRSIRLKGYDYTQEGLYFITLCIQDREHIFGEIKNGDMHLNAFGKIAEHEWLNTANIRDNVSLHEYIIMPNHIHGIIEITFQKETANEIGAFKSPSQSIGSIIRGYKIATIKRIKDFINSNLKDYKRELKEGDKKENYRGELKEGDKKENYRGELKEGDKKENYRGELKEGDKKENYRGELKEGDKKENYRGELQFAPTGSAPTGSAPTGSAPTGSAPTGSAPTEKPALAATRKIINLDFKIWQRNYYEHIIRNKKAYKNISNYIINNPKKWEEDKFNKKD
ncbi:transposase [Flavobacterium sp. CS20]|uniref:transposase n=1 Tax=Flavobacterium sp. CS20 TaxID=2775246 RepID=UPI001FFCA079|nr:transposase [Flavobacterium sp. CS20]